MKRTKFDCGVITHVGLKDLQKEIFTEASQYNIDYRAIQEKARFVVFPSYIQGGSDHQEQNAIPRSRPGHFPGRLAQRAVVPGIGLVSLHNIRWRRAPWISEFGSRPTVCHFFIFNLSPSAPGPERYRARWFAGIVTSVSLSRWVAPLSFGCYLVSMRCCGSCWIGGGLVDRR